MLNIERRTSKWEEFEEAASLNHGRATWLTAPTLEEKFHGQSIG
jgi:hypothetical protein